MLALISNQDYKPNLLNLSFRSSCCSNGNIVYGSHNDIYRDINMLKPLTKSKFPIFLVSSRITKLNYVMKVFPHQNGKAPLYFMNEARFASLQHPHIVRSLYFEKQREVRLDNSLVNISYTIIEYAANGDFCKFLKENHERIDDKLVRTYFRQLVDGLEYLHRNKVAHMDLKLDNLLLGNDYTLKIGDFDMAHYEEDSLILSRGTKYYRAPEVWKGRCKETKAADIYSAGVILFALKAKGEFPQLEDNIVNGVNYNDLLYNDIPKFWATHCRALQTDFDEDFKELFIAMTRLNPEDRASIETIKESRWYNGPCYNDEELKIRMSKIVSH